MKEIFDSVEGKMSNSDFYTTLLVSFLKATGLVVLILIGGAIICRVILPAVNDGAAGLYFITWAATLVAFLYVFPTSEWLGYGGRVAHIVYSGLYAGTMYIGGEIIFIAMILLGMVVALVLVFSDVFFTGAFTYKDLKEWVKRKQKIEEKERNASAAEIGEF